MDLICANGGAKRECLNPTVIILFIKCFFSIKKGPGPLIVDALLSAATLSVSKKKKKKKKKLRLSLPGCEIKQVINFPVWPTVGTLSFFITAK